MLQDLQVAARSQRGQRLQEEAVPVVNAAEEFAHVDEVEVVVWVGPVKVYVFDLKVAVRGDEGGLDGGEVGADYVRGGVEVGYFAGGELVGVNCGGNETYIAQIPVPVPRSRIFCYVGVSGGNWVR